MSLHLEGAFSSARQPGHDQHGHDFTMQDRRRLNGNHSAVADLKAWMSNCMTDFLALASKTHAENARSTVDAAISERCDFLRDCINRILPKMGAGLLGASGHRSATTAYQASSQGNVLVSPNDHGTAIGDPRPGGSKTGTARKRRKTSLVALGDETRARLVRRLRHGGIRVGKASLGESAGRARFSAKDAEIVVNLDDKLLNSSLGDARLQTMDEIVINEMAIVLATLMANAPQADVDLRAPAQHVLEDYNAMIRDNMNALSACVARSRPEPHARRQP
jgi:hypothetical protein